MGTIFLIKKPVVGVIFAFMLFCHCPDKKACNVFKQNLIIINDRLKEKQGLNLMDVFSAITFLEKTTGIKSHSNWNYAGRFDPTSEDYYNWSNWFQANKGRIYWDKKERTVYVHK